MNERMWRSLCPAVEVPSCVREKRMNERIRMKKRIRMNERIRMRILTIVPHTRKKMFWCRWS
jgi:hypothetical protein